MAKLNWKPPELNYEPIARGTDKKRTVKQWNGNFHFYPFAESGTRLVSVIINYIQFVWFNGMWIAQKENERNKKTQLENLFVRSPLSRQSHCFMEKLWYFLSSAFHSECHNISIFAFILGSTILQSGQTFGFGRFIKPGQCWPLPKNRPSFVHSMMHDDCPICRFDIKFPKGDPNGITAYSCRSYKDVL